MPVAAALRKPSKASATMSIRAFARWRGVSPKAVRQRIDAGGLQRSVKTINGRRVIVDAELAVTEWEAHTRPRVVDKPARARPPSALAKSTQREREARAKAAEFELERKLGKYVLAAEVERRWSARAIAVRTKLLGLGARAKQRLAHLTNGDLAVLDALVREALEELADDTKPDPKGDQP